MKVSLRAPLIILWLLIVVICVALAFLLLSIFRLGVGARRSPREAPSLDSQIWSYVTHALL